MKEPNPSQENFVEGLDGFYLVDAGAGTGKTFAVTRRYIRLLEEVEPSEIFLSTFTSNAAEEMTARIAAESDYSAADIYEAPISTFHSHCRELLRRHGFDAPGLLGLEENLPRDLEILESQVRELQEFSEFLASFRARHGPRFREFLVVSEEGDLLELLKSLASKGVLPEEDGWYAGSDSYLDGDRDEFREQFRAANRPVEEGGNTRQSELRRRLYALKWKELHPEAPELSEIRGDYGSKQVREDFLRRCFDEDREELKEFVRLLYMEYLEHCLDRNYLNFSFIMALAYVLLRERRDVREQEGFRYVMIDEFQDTNEVQLKLALLLADEPNLAVVGDWKQSIYSFQHASVENILEFEDRVESYVDDLGEKVGFDPPETQRISLRKNYRSAQDILDAAEHALDLPAHGRDNPEELKTEKLESQTERQHATVEKFAAAEEVESVLAQIQKVQGSGDYLDSAGEQLDYSDIAVLTRTRSLGLELQREARSRGIPVAYEGGVELFSTEPGKLLLAWLRILGSDSRRGWVVVLERAGYGLEEARQIISEEQYPESMKEFTEELSGSETLAAMARKVFNRYGLESAFTEKIVEVVESVAGSSLMNLGNLIEFIEENIAQREIYQVDASPGSESVKVQTIHAAKGLEYPCVILAGVNDSVFPSRVSDSSAIRLMGSAGLRCTKTYSAERGYVYDSWRALMISKVRSGKYDEERRLMYVAMTRAENHLVVAAEEGEQSPFWTELPVREVGPPQGPEEVQDGEPEAELLEVKLDESVGRVEELSRLENVDRPDIQEFAVSHLETGRNPSDAAEQEVAERLESGTSLLRGLVYSGDGRTAKLGPQPEEDGAVLLFVRGDPEDTVMSYASALKQAVEGWSSGTELRMVKVGD